MAEIRHVEIRHDVNFLCWERSDLDKISQTGAEWHVDCGDMVEIETRSRIPIWRTFWRIQWHVIPEPRATLQGERIPSAILKIVFHRILFFCFLNVVWTLANGGFRIVSDTLVIFHLTICYTTFRGVDLLFVRNCNYLRVTAEENLPYQIEIFITFHSWVFEPFYVWAWLGLVILIFNFLVSNSTTNVVSAIRKSSTKFGLSISFNCPKELFGSASRYVEQACPAHRPNVDNMLFIARPEYGIMQQCSSDLVSILTGEDVDDGTDDDFEVVFGWPDDAERQCDKQQYQTPDDHRWRSSDGACVQSQINTQNTGRQASFSGEGQARYENKAGKSNMRNAWRFRLKNLYNHVRNSANKAN